MAEDKTAEYGYGAGDGVVEVNPKPQKGLTSKVIDFVEKLIVKFMYDSSQPHHYLAGNYAPVHETPPTKDLHVIGHLPECLNGEFVRVGSNPKFGPVAGFHCMIHGLRIKDGKATYVSRYVKTSRLKQEEFFGGSKFMKIGDLKGIFGLLMVNIQMLRTKLKVLDVTYGYGTDAIKVLEDGDLQTLGLLDYDKRLKHSFTAHPKVDPYTANAWEEGDEVVLITCRSENPDLDMVNGAVKEKLEITNELYEMRFNMKTGLASQKKLSASAVDFPRVNDCYTGRKQRYVYGTILDSIAKVIGIVKFDLQAEAEAGKTKLEVGGNVKGIFELGSGRFGSEAVYVPREPGTSSEEDDGYLIFFSHDEKTGKSAVIVIDAKTMSVDPVAVVELPHRVPYGFHAFFVTEVSSQIIYTFPILQNF
ncbi:hypothetical protein LWI28_029213 [Acer negundo]|uniref:carotenoid 9,10-dioxygenase n=1 Tax=Acer negundo TaxID=4023 RepID=A0AAD5IPV0_ACENE|nr:hypothetical protein LWI28_029213 [Acer negundo]